MFKLTDKEREEIRKQHEEATKKHFNHKEELKQGLKKPESKEETKKEK